MLQDKESCIEIRFKVKGWFWSSNVKLIVKFDEVVEMDPFIILLNEVDKYYNSVSNNEKSML